MSASPRDVDFLAARREACILKSCAPVTGGLIVVSSNDSVLALVGLSLAEVHLELPQQGYASGFVHATGGGPCLFDRGCLDAIEYSDPIVHSGEYHAQDWGFDSFLC